MDIVFRGWAHSWQLYGLKYVAFYTDLYKFLFCQLLQKVNSKHI